MASSRCSCVYCNARNDDSNYIKCEEEHSCCCDCDSCPGDIFKWADNLRNFIAHTHGIDYIVHLDKKIKTYVQSLIDNCPLPDTYLDEDRALGCHIKDYIREFTINKYLGGSITRLTARLNLASIILEACSIRNLFKNGKNSILYVFLMFFNLSLSYIYFIII